MKTYRGVRLGKTAAAHVSVDVEENGKITPLHQRVYHSPSGFNWGYGGSGPADLARSILWDLLGEEPARRLYMAFKWAHVARWGREWAITSGEIEAWMASPEAQAGPTHRWTVGVSG